MKAEQARELRGAILVACRVGLPDGTSEGVLLSALAGLDYPVTQALLRTHLKYLEEKGYVRGEEVEHAGLSRNVWHITARGQDLLDGHIPDDPGILVTHWG